MNKQELQELGLSILEFVLNIVIIFSIVYFIRSYFIAPFQVFGPSMCDTFNYQENKCVRNLGEYIIVGKSSTSKLKDYISKGINRGDVIVFNPPHNKKDFYIKRIVGMPNETVIFKDKKVIIKNKNGEFELTEKYIGKENNRQTFPLNPEFNTFHVPEDHYFVMGDNRRQSTDSRSCFKPYYNGACAHGATPFINLSHIEGKAWIVLWPFNLVRSISSTKYIIDEITKTD